MSRFLRPLGGLEEWRSLDEGEGARLEQVDAIPLMWRDPTVGPLGSLDIIPPWARTASA